jgi:DNA invertase Pin-like site-specific DNA recombinase
LIHAVKKNMQIVQVLHSWDYVLPPRAVRRQPRLRTAEIKRLKAEGMGASAIAKQLGITRNSVCRLLGE